LENIVSGMFTPVLAKHSKSFSLIDCISVGVDRVQRNFEPMRKQVEAWQRSELTDVTANFVIYEAFVEGRLEAPKHLARTVRDLYFEPNTKFWPRTIWSLSSAFTSGFKELDPIPQFKATAKAPAADARSRDRQAVLRLPFIGNDVRWRPVGGMRIDVGYDRDWTVDGIDIYIVSIDFDERQVSLQVFCRRFD
jgi:hypothetical protein